MYFVLRGASVHCFFTLWSLGQLCPVFPRFKKLPSLPGVNKRDSTSFFRMSWSNKNKVHVSFIEQNKFMNFIIALTFYIILYKIRKKCKTKRNNIHICCNFFGRGVRNVKLLQRFKKKKIQFTRQQMLTTCIMETKKSKMAENVRSLKHNFS